MATGYTVVPSSLSGLLGAASPQFAVSALGGVFNPAGNGQTVTVTSNNSADLVQLISGATIIGPSVGPVITFQPTATALQFYFDLLPGTQGARTLSFSNNQAWTDAASEIYTAYPPYILPLGVTPQTQPLQRIDLYLSESETRPFQYTFLDQNANAVNLSGKTLKFDVFIDNGIDQSIQWSYTSPTNIAVGGSGNNVVTVIVQSANTATFGVYYYALWDVTDSLVLATGKFQIAPMPE
jgi:hypothetical protein